MNEMLLTEAANLVPLGPWQVWLLGQGLVPRPTVKKKRLSTFCGTFAGNLALARLRNLLVKFAAKEVSLRGGRVGLKKGSFVVLEEEEDELFRSYLRIPAVVELSKVPGPVT